MVTFFKSRKAEEAGNPTENFGPGVTQRELAKGKEYQLFVHIVDMLNEFCFRGMDPQNPLYASALPFIRRFGKRDYFYLKPEEEKVEGFPDIFIVREDIVCIVDHFKIDSSLRREESGDNGTEYLALLGRNKDNVFRAQKSEDFRRMLFSPENLRKCACSMMEKKAAKIEQYKLAVANYIAKRGPDFAKVDGMKPREVWFLVEDVSPETKRYSDDAIEQIKSLVDEHSNIAGVVYAYCGYPNRLPETVFDIRPIVQDYIMREG